MSSSEQRYLNFIFLFGEVFYTAMPADYIKEMVDNKSVLQLMSGKCDICNKPFIGARFIERALFHLNFIHTGAEVNSTNFSLSHLTLSMAPKMTELEEINSVSIKQFTK
jgi:hypothetical protein